MITKEFTEQMVKYMKSDRSVPLKEKCKKIGVSVQTYYKACKKYGFEGKISPKLPNFNKERALKIMSACDEDSGTLKCNSSQDGSE